MKKAFPISDACQTLEEDLVLYYYGEIDAAEHQRLERHLSRCLACRHFVDDLRGLLPKLAKRQELPENFWEHYYRETVAKLNQREGYLYRWRNFFAPMRTWLMPAFGTVAVATLALGLFFAKGSLPWFLDGSSAKLPDAILADANQLEFFSSLDMLEALSQLDEHDGDKMKSRSDRSSLSSIEQAAT